jgi:hypothetical protein
VKKSPLIKDVLPSAKEFIKHIKLALAGKSVSDNRIGDYTFCKKMSVSKPEMDEMAEEDVLSFGWMIRLEAKHKPKGD